MEERREISRVEYKTNGVVVICDTQEKIYVDVKDISPLGMGICVPEGHERPSRKTGDHCGRNTDHVCGGFPRRKAGRRLHIHWCACDKIHR